MTNIHVDQVGEMAVIECEGRFVRSDEAFRLRDAVTAQRNAHVIVLDLTEMRAIGGGYAVEGYLLLVGGQSKNPVSLSVRRRHEASAYLRSAWPSSAIISSSDAISNSDIAFVFSNRSCTDREGLNSLNRIS